LADGFEGGERHGQGWVVKFAGSLQPSLGPRSSGWGKFVGGALQFVKDVLVIHRGVDFEPLKSEVGRAGKRIRWTRSSRSATLRGFIN
jgi:hypothetical protein